MKTKFLQLLWWLVFIACLPAPILAALFLAIGEWLTRFTVFLDYVLYPIWPGPGDPPMSKSEY